MKPKCGAWDSEVWKKGWSACVQVEAFPVFPLARSIRCYTIQACHSVSTFISWNSETGVCDSVQVKPTQNYILLTLKLFLST